MKIVRRISDNVVLYLVPDSDPAVVNDRGLHTRTTRALDIGPDTHEVVEGVAAPELFVGGAMAWDDGWTVTDQTAYDAGVAAHHFTRFPAINAERERRLATGAPFTVAGVADPVPLQGRAFDQTVYLALLMRAQGYKAAGVTDPVLTLRDGADTIHALTPDQMISLITQSMTWFESVMATSWAMKDKSGDFTRGIPTDYTSDEHWP